MRRVNRNRVAPPAVLTLRGELGDQELRGARRHYRRMPRKPYDAKLFKAYRHPEVKQALRELFHGKCAYCEFNYSPGGPGDVEHYRPKGRVKEQPKHSGYWWLAMVWSNLLPSCSDCNRSRKQITITPGMTMADVEKLQLQPAKDTSGKADSFPTANRKWADPRGKIAAEQPLLIDPTLENPNQHLRWVLDEELSIVVPQLKKGVEDPRGVASIAVFGLTRVALVQSRTKLLNTLRLNREKVWADLDEADKTRDPASARRLRAEAMKKVKHLRALKGAKEPYSAMVKAFIYQFDRELKARLAVPAKNR